MHFPSPDFLGVWSLTPDVQTQHEWVGARDPVCIWAAEAPTKTVTRGSVCTTTRICHEVQFKFRTVRAVCELFMCPLCYCQPLGPFLETQKGQPSTRRKHLLLYSSARVWARPLTTAPGFSIGPSMSPSLQKRRQIISDGQNPRCPLQPLPYFHSFSCHSSIRPFSETLSFAVLTVRS